MAKSLEHQALLRVAAAAAGASHVEDVLELAAEEALKAVGAASLSVSRYEIGRNEIRTLINVGDLGPGETRFPEDETYPASDYAMVRELIENHTPYFNDAQDPDCDPVAAHLLRALGKSSDVGVPIMVEGEVWGEVWATRRPGEPPFDAGDAEFLTGIAGQFSVAIARAELFSTVSRFAYEDSLTALPNRRAFDERLGRALERAGRTGRSVAFLLCDVDGLKEINDSAGHEAGDEALRSVAAALVRAAADVPGAFVARLAGDEFCILLEDRSVGEALEVGSRALDEASRDGGQSISCGAAALEGEAATGGALLAEADAALYSAKRQGGRRVCGGGGSWPEPRDRRARREDGRGVLLAAMDELVAELDGPLARCSALERLEAVAGVLTAAGDFAYWAVSVASDESDLVRDAVVGDNRDSRHRGIRVTAGADAYRLSEFPVTRAVVEAGHGAFVIPGDDPAADPAERALLGQLGFSSVIGATAGDGRDVYLVELYGDDRTARAADFVTALRLGVRAAMPPPARQGGEGVADAGASDRVVVSHGRAGTQDDPPSAPRG